MTATAGSGVQLRPKAVSRVLILVAITVGLSLLRGCRERGLHTAIETCGHAPWETWQSLLPLPILLSLTLPSPSTKWY